MHLSRRDHFLVADGFRALHLTVGVTRPTWFFAVFYISCHIYSINFVVENIF